MNTTQTSKSHSRVGNHVLQGQNNNRVTQPEQVKSHASQRQNDKHAMRQEIEDLKMKLYMHNEGHPIPGMTYPSMKKVMMTIGRDRGLLQARPSPTKKSPSPKGSGNDAMSKALYQLSKSPFTRRIKGATLPRRFQQPTFTLYNGKTVPVEHVSQFNQRMTVHSRDEALMCKVFPSSLGPVVMRWFNGLNTNSINLYR